MKSFNLKPFLPHLAALAIFMVITLSYFMPLLEGKQLRQSDITQFQGASKEISDYRQATGKEALWTNSMFGGMPAYQISVVYASNMVKYFDHFFHAGLPRPASTFFLYLIGRHISIYGII